MASLHQPKLAAYQCAFSLLFSNPSWLWRACRGALSAEPSAITCPEAASMQASYPTILQRHDNHASNSGTIFAHAHASSLGQQQQSRAVSCAN